MKTDSRTKEDKKSKGKNKKKKKHKILRTILLLILIAIIAAGGLIGYKVYKNGGGIQGILATFLGHSERTLEQMPEFYCLLLGKSENLTDTIMVAKYDPKTQQASLLSIPRDSFVGSNKNRATASDKINSKYQISPQSTLDAVNKLTGLNIKSYITVDTKALRHLVDTVGGIYFDVPIDMDYDDSSQDLHIHLSKGYQKLNGEQAEGVVRFRHNNDYTTYPSEYGDNDIGRMKTQRAFLTTVAKQMLKPENIFKINSFLEIAKEDVETNIDWEEARDYIPYLVEFNTENLKTDVAPGEATYCNGVAVFLVDEDGIQNIVNNLFITKDVTTGEEQTPNTDTPKTTDKNSDIKVEILNASGVKSNLSKAETQLEKQGFNVTKTGTANSTARTSIINRTKMTTEKEEAIKSLLGVGNISSGEDNSNVDFTIILGRDY